MKKYNTRNELAHFHFTDAYIADVQITKERFEIELDNVTILPENSCNRDIRHMRANQLILKIRDYSIVSLIEEGFKTYNADGKLMEETPDLEVEEEKQLETIKSFTEGLIYSLEQKENQYIFNVDGANERSYVLAVEGSEDEESWDRFLNKEENMGSGYGYM